MLGRGEGEREGDAYASFVALLKVDACATSIELANAEHDMARKLEALRDEHTKRHVKAEKTLVEHEVELKEHDKASPPLVLPSPPPYAQAPP